MLLRSYSEIGTIRYSYHSHTVLSLDVVMGRRPSPKEEHPSLPTPKGTMACRPPSARSTLSTPSDASNDELDKTLMGEIEPGLWVGGLGAVKEIRKRSDRSWTVISIIKAEKLSLFLSKTIQEIRSRNLADVSGSGVIKKIKHIEWNIADKSQSDLLCPRLEEILVAMDDCLLVTNNDDDNNNNNHGYCLVHCAFGISRSVSICAAWLISRRRLTLSQALQRIRDVRPDAAPNMGFLASLRSLERCEGNVAAAIERMHLSKGR